MKKKHHQTPKWCHNKMRSSILDFSSQSNNPSIKFWRISSVASWLFVPGFETQSSSANHFQVCRFTSMHFIKNLHAQKSYTCFIADFLLRLATYKLMYYCHPFAEPWLCWHQPNTMWISAKRLCFVIRLFGSFFLFLFSSSSTPLCWAWIPNANYKISVCGKT